MAATTVAPPGTVHMGDRPLRSVTSASATALGALMLRDVVVLRKHIWEFVLRTLIQPFLLCFVFLYVFPKIGQGIGGQGAAEQSAFATILVPGVVGISIMFQGVQSIALVMAQEFGYTARSRTGSRPHALSGSSRWPRCYRVRRRGRSLQPSCSPSPPWSTPRACKRTYRCIGASSSPSSPSRVLQWPVSGSCSARASSRAT